MSANWTILANNIFTKMSQDKPFKHEGKISFLHLPAAWLSFSVLFCVLLNYTAELTSPTHPLFCKVCSPRPKGWPLGECWAVWRKGA